ncbi:MAG: hypothetical protein GX800_00190 [Clostridiaceae bacterium]|nr:hypothetical protein [Clostridiaceae bacterium]
MGKIRTIKIMLIAVFISVEFLAVLVAIGLGLWCPQFVTKIGNLFAQQGWQIYCALVGLPLGGLLFGANTLHSLLHPKDAEQKGLYKWPDYSPLRYFSYIPLILCFIGVATALIFLIDTSLLSPLLTGTIYLAVTFAWTVSIVTLKMAQLRIDAILGGAD